ncbi:Sporulation-specific extracellular nuclease precursor [compost metagenome]
MYQKLIILLAAIMFVVGCSNTQVSTDGYDAKLVFPVDKYPKTAAHIYLAIESGESAICTIDRSGAEENRSESLKGIPTKKGHDRDEWPMAMCAEGGEGASVQHIPSADNRGAGAWVGNQLRDYPDGTRILFIVSDPGISQPESTPPPSKETLVYNNCAEVRAVGAAPIRKGDIGYSSKLDGDGDGIACE